MPDHNAIQQDAQHIMTAYGQRREQGQERQYDPLTLSGAWGYLEVQRHLLWGFSQIADSIKGLQEKEILEIGCGSGGHLIRLAALGVLPDRLHGIDLLPERIEEARRRHPALDLRCGNAADLPWPDKHFDILFQTTCLSSVLDPTVRSAIAQEMARVLKPEGAILSLDFIWNPTNRDTIGIRKKELRRLFPSAEIQQRRCILAPPLGRPLARWGRPLAAILDCIPFLRLHSSAVIRPSVHQGF